ncbi:hypothetical protein OIE66_36005 [Nonomuraea sp. NBC_01738]|uniref:hypothetical protein n=1 Tax=Nonomuraea sp. NBC_01738 TaxID=2976003 RepID=UPI002E1328E9|nr:hypothetical protein OIE66_36005 [Nonomuraea sp. NBC_01738]
MVPGWVVLAALGDERGLWLAFAMTVLALVSGAAAAVAVRRRRGEREYAPVNDHVPPS